MWCRHIGSSQKLLIFHFFNMQVFGWSIVLAWLSNLESPAISGVQEDDTILTPETHLKCQARSLRIIWWCLSSLTAVGELCLLKISINQQSPLPLLSASPCHSLYSIKPRYARFNSLPSRQAPAIHPAFLTLLVVSHHAIYFNLSTLHDSFRYGTLEYAGIIRKQCL